MKSQFAVAVKKPADHVRLAFWRSYWSAGFYFLDKRELRVQFRFKENVSEGQEAALWHRIFEALDVFGDEETKEKEVLLNK